MAKYDPLKAFLQCQPGPTPTLQFADIAEIVGVLPHSAYRHPAWWANEQKERHVQARAWMSAGWRVDSVKPGVPEGDVSAGLRLRRDSKWLGS